MRGRTYASKHVRGSGGGTQKKKNRPIGPRKSAARCRRRRIGGRWEAPVALSLQKAEWAGPGAQGEAGAEGDAGGAVLRSAAVRAAGRGGARR